MSKKNGTDIAWDSEFDENPAGLGETPVPAFSPKEKKEKKKSACEIFLVAPTYILIKKEDGSLKKIYGKWDGVKSGDEYYD
jgi:hypothetical protein